MAAKEIREKVEKKRLEIKQESERLRREAKENHVCPNCGTKVSANRLYCSNDCYIKFFVDHDYSRTSRELRDYKEELEYEFSVNHPKKEREPWTQPVAMKEHTCYVCDLPIQKGEKYDKYVRLPEIDEYFDEAPYESLSYHLSCTEFISRFYECDFFDEGYNEDDIYDIFRVFAWECGVQIKEMKERVRTGNIPTVDQIEAIGKKYDWDFQILTQIGDPLFAEMV